MISSKIYGKVQIIKNQLTVVPASLDYFHIELYSLNTVWDKIRTLLRVNSEKDTKKSFEFDTDNLHSINRKFVNEGKAIISFRIKKGKKII